MTKEEKKEYNHQYYLKNRDKELERMKQWREDNPEYMKNYKQEHKKEITDYNKYRYLEKKEIILAQAKQYWQENKEKVLEYNKKFNKTPIGRAVKLCSAYKRNDKKYNRGECTLTAQWIVDNIFSKPCHYCGETGWEIMGCDRINNDLPHTPDNVVPCCKECNIKRQKKSYEEFKKQ